MELRQIDIDSILWDLESLSVFFDRPLEVKIPGTKRESYQVGDGPGGLHWSLFTRGMPCIGCGKCCQSSGGVFKRRLWFWWENEPRPVHATEPMTLTINGVDMRVWVHISSDDTKCDFLQSKKIVDGLEVQYCGVYETRPSHCMASFTTESRKFRLAQGNTRLLARTLPSRNWRWPKCPIDIATAPRKESDIANDKYLFSVWKTHFASIPGSFIDLAEKLYLENLQGQSTILFRDHLGGTNG